MRSGGGCAQSTAATAAAMATARILVAPSLHTGFLFLSSELKCSDASSSVAASGAALINKQGGEFLGVANTTMSVFCDGFSCHTSLPIPVLYLNEPQAPPRRAPCWWTKAREQNTRLLMCSQPGAKPLLHGYFMLRIRSQEHLKTMYRTQPRPARPALLPLRSDALCSSSRGDVCDAPCHGDCGYWGIAA
jgi:hypothetical protein